MTVQWAELVVFTLLFGLVTVLADETDPQDYHADEGSRGSSRWRGCCNRPPRPETV